MSYEITGQVIHIEPPAAYGAKNFRKALCVLEVGEKYPQKIPIEASGKKADLFTEANIAEGDTVTISADLQGREWNGKYFLSLSAWKVQIESEAYGTGRQQDAKDDDRPPIPPDSDAPADADDDIPF